jgi:uncharacterized membrane protein
MKQAFVAYAAGLVCLLAMDAPWLALMGPRFYSAQLGHLLSAEPQWAAAGAFYLLYALGMSALVVLPAVRGGMSAGHIFRQSAMLGLVAYGTYDLTNHATLRDWPTVVTAVDMAWGTLLTGVASVVAAWAARRAN